MPSPRVQPTSENNQPRITILTSDPRKNANAPNYSTTFSLEEMTQSEKTASSTSSVVSSSTTSQIPSDIPSYIPSQSFSDAPSLIPSDQPSLIPSDQPSLTPSHVPSLAPTQTSPSYPPSQTVSSTPSKSPTSAPSNSSSQTPTVAPSVFVADSIPSESGISAAPNAENNQITYSTVQLVEIITQTENEMSEDDVKLFQSICKSEFLPTFLPKIEEAGYERIDCVILSQSIAKRRKLQEESDQTYFLLSVLLEIKSAVALPDHVTFSHVVSLTFETFSEEFRSMLGSMQYFPSIHSSDRGSTFNGVQGGVNPPSSNEGMTTVMLVGALLGGAALALFVSALIIIHRSRQPWGAGTENNRPSEETRQNRCFSQKARSVPKVIGFITDIAVSENEIPASGPRSIASDKSSNPEDAPSNMNKECHSKTTEGSGSVDSSLHGLDLLQSSVSSGESKIANRKRMAKIKTGCRRKSDENSQKHREIQHLDSPESDDSIDLECGVESTTNTHAQTRMEDCYTAPLKGDYVQRNKTPDGENFLQMHLDNAAHTGEVLNDLGQFEEEWHDRLTRVRVSASAETPRQANTHYSRPPRSRNTNFSPMSNDLLREFTDAESL